LFAELFNIHNWSFRMRSLQALAIASLVAIAGCGGDSNTAPGGTGDPGGTPGPIETNAVSVVNDAFGPSSILVTSGMTVTWTLASNAVQHNVTFSDGPTSGNLNANGTYKRTFNAAGTFPYHCTIHPGMNGMVTVK
jgi:plastocyanin